MSLLKQAIDAATSKKVIHTFSDIAGLFFSSPFVEIVTLLRMHIFKILWMFFLLFCSVETSFLLVLHPR
jgi:hypothetical protein